MANFVNNACRVVGAHLPTAASTTVFTASGFGQAIGVRCANLTAADVPVTIRFFSVRDADEYVLIFEHPVPGNKAIHFPLEAFAMYEDDEIRVQAGSGAAIDVVLTIAEVAGRSG